MVHIAMGAVIEPVHQPRFGRQLQLLPQRLCGKRRNINRARFSREQTSHLSFSPRGKPPAQRDGAENGNKRGQARRKSDSA